MRRLTSLSSMPWICFGDFNEIMHVNEKIEGNDRRLSMVNAFREVVKDCGLTDLGCTGYPITRSNNRYGSSLIKERLDVFLCN